MTFAVQIFFYGRGRHPHQRRWQAVVITVLFHINVDHLHMHRLLLFLSQYVWYRTAIVYADGIMIFSFMTCSIVCIMIAYECIRIVIYNSMLNNSAIFLTSVILRKQTSYSYFPPFVNTSMAEQLGILAKNTCPLVLHDNYMIFVSTKLAFLTFNISVAKTDIWRSEYFPCTLIAITGSDNALRIRPHQLNVNRDSEAWSPYV